MTKNRFLSQELYRAVTVNDKRKVKKLLKLGADPDFHPKKEANLLWAAVSHHSPDIFNLLADYGADLNYVEKQGDLIVKEHGIIEHMTKTYYFFSASTNKKYRIFEMFESAVNRGCIINDGDVFDTDLFRTLADLQGHADPPPFFDESFNNELPSAREFSEKAEQCFIKGIRRMLRTVNTEREIIIRLPEKEKDKKDLSYRLEYLDKFIRIPEANIKTILDEASEENPGQAPEKVKIITKIGEETHSVYDEASFILGRALKRDTA